MCSIISIILNKIEDVEINIFYLDENPRICAQYHCDKHVVKMIVETAQLLSTAHRIVDGQIYIDDSSGRKIKRFRLNSSKEFSLYKATHFNHPCAVWARETIGNYNWLYELFLELLGEYTFRYGKIHACSKLVNALKDSPIKIKTSSFEALPSAMPNEYVIPGQCIKSYRKYYQNGKKHLHHWKNREIPNWITE